MSRRIVRPAALTLLLDRDRQLLRLVGQFGVVTSSHIHELLFPDVGYTPVDRALKRLLNLGYLSRIDRRLVGAGRGASGHYLYELSREGFRLLYDSPYRRAERSKLLHYLAVVDCAVVIRQLERAGRVTVRAIVTEPECWVTVGGHELKPDLYVDLERPDGRRRELYLEIDMASEGQRQVRGKLDRYVAAWHVSESESFPGVLWVAIDGERASELRRAVSGLDEDARRLFRVVTLENVDTALV